MKNDPLILEAEVVKQRALSHPLGVAFDNATMVKTIPAEANDHYAGLWVTLREFLKPTLSNLFLLGCLMGLFVLYCCSCVIHALKFPSRKKSS